MIGPPSVTDCSGLREGGTWKTSSSEIMLYTFPGSPWKKNRVPSKAWMRGSPVPDPANRLHQIRWLLLLNLSWAILAFFSLQNLFDEIISKFSNAKGLGGKFQCQWKHICQKYKTKPKLPSAITTKIPHSSWSDKGNTLASYFLSPGIYSKQLCFPYSLHLTRSGFFSTWATLSASLK